MKTLKEIAELAGVGTATVSRVINNKPDVNKETRQRVLKVIEEVNYIPNASARNLKQINTNLICVIVKGLSNFFLINIAERIQTHIEAYDYIPLIHFIDERDDEILFARQTLIDKKPLGFIFLGGSAPNRQNDLEMIDVPCVFSTTNANGISLPNVSSVCVDDRNGAKTAMSKLLEMGHRNIIILGGELLNSDLVYNRYLGVLDSFLESAIVFDDKHYYVSKFSLKSAYRVMQAALSENEGITALFSMSDIMAIGAAKAIADAGLSIPGDISIIGFDGIDLARYHIPGLATMRQPSGEIAEKSVMLLIKNIKAVAEASHISLEAEFIEGQSLKKVGNRGGLL